MMLGAGVLIGFGLSGCSFNVVIGAFGKLLPEKWRGLAFGAGTAAGSFGQFLFPPIGNVLIAAVGWQETLLIFGVTLLLIVPLAIRSPRDACSTREQPAPRNRSPRRWARHSGTRAMSSWCWASSPAASSSPS